MLSFIKYMLKRLLYPKHYCNDAYVNFLRRGGAQIGKGTFFYAPQKRPVDETSLPFIEIGSNCRITHGVVILGHDYSYAVLRPIYHCMLRKCTVTKIGNNCFLGMNSIILPGAEIGDNVVVGAGSVVASSIPSNVVVVGNPAKIICSIEDYYKKNESRFESYARLYYKRMSSYFKRDLTEKEMGWYAALFRNRQGNVFSELRVDGDDKSEVVKDCLNYQPIYNDIEEFKKTC